MIRIQEATVYKVDGTAFPSREKAVDHVEGLINLYLQNELAPKGFTVTEIVKITDAVLSLAHPLAIYLDCLNHKDED